MSINLPYVVGTGEKQHLILKSHKIRSTLFTESTLRKLLLATEDESNVVYEIDCSNCDAIYFSEFKRS